MNRYAILIGVSQFHEYAAMPCAANDVRGMAELLTSPEYGLFSDPIIFSHHSDVEIRRAINRVFRDAKSTDQILLYYSGHGEVDAKGQFHLITANTEKDVLESSSIPTRFIRDLIDKSRCEKVMLILDCCFSGAIEGAFKSDVVNSQLNLMAKGNGKGIYILTASRGDEPAKQGAEYSIFTHHILSGIREGKVNSNKDGFVSMNHLFDYVKDSVPNDAQTPTSHYYKVQGNELYVARTHRTYSKAEETKEERTAAQKQIRAATKRKLSTRQLILWPTAIGFVLLVLIIGYSARTKYFPPETTSIPALTPTPTPTPALPPTPTPTLTPAPAPTRKTNPKPKPTPTPKPTYKPTPSPTPKPCTAREKLLGLRNCKP